MISISLRDFRGIAQADIICSPLALAVGANGSGKSSIAQATAACLVGDALPKHFELTKGKADALVRRGSKTGQVRLKSETGEAKMSWPDCERSSVGAEAPHATTIAAGLVSIATTPLKERAALLEPYLRSEPTLEDLTAAMAATERFSERAPGVLWKEIEAKGWDDTCVAYEVVRRDAGRDWEKITGTKFGSDKASSWRPEGWRDEFEDADPAPVAAAIETARKELEEAIAGSAVDEAEIKRLTEAAAPLNDLGTKIGKATVAAEAAATAVNQSIAARMKMPEVPGGGSVPCPHCGGAILIRKEGPVTTFEKFEMPSPEEVKLQRDAIAVADGELSRLRAEKSAADTAMTTVRSAYQAAKAAKDALDKMGAGKTPPEQVATRREELAEREASLRMITQVNEATKLYRTWLSANLKIGILAASGLRAKKLGEAVQAFNQAVLAPLCETAGWPAVNITEELTVRMGERSYPLLSGGEKFRVRATLQIAMAELDQSSMVVLDEADLLDTPGRNGLFSMLAEASLPALIAMTSVRGATIPDLAAAELGETYILDGAVAKPLETKAAA